MQVIDADGHVEEGTALFGCLSPEFYPRRPLPVSFATDTIYGNGNAVWLIDGETYPKRFGKGAVTFVTPTLMESAKLKAASIPAQELTDVDARLRDLDKMGVQQQVIFPTLFLTTTTDDVELEVALLRAYNSFMADACAKSADRLKFAAIVPIRDVSASIREIQRAHESGAVAIMLLGIGWDRGLGDRALWPFYEEAARLGMPICLHFGWGSPDITNAFGPGYSFNSATLPVLMGARSILGSGVMEEIPNLRVAFLETGALWMPWMLHQIKRGFRSAKKKDPADYFREGRAYVACEADEDINYLVSCIGEDALVVGSDYPHSDPSHEDRLEDAVMERDDVPLRVREKILTSNPQRLYGL